MTDQADNVRRGEGLEFISQAEAEKILKSDRSTFWLWRQRPVNPMPCVKIGGKVLFIRHEIEAWALSQRERPPAPPKRGPGRPRKTSSSVAQ